MTLIIHATLPTLGNAEKTIGLLREAAREAGCLTPTVSIFWRGEKSEAFLVEVRCADAPKETPDGG